MQILKINNKIWKMSKRVSTLLLKIYNKLQFLDFFFLNDEMKRETLLIEKNFAFYISFDSI